MAGRVGRLGRARARVQGNLHYCEANSDVAPIKPRGAAWRGVARRPPTTRRVGDGESHGGSLAGRTQSGRSPVAVISWWSLAMAEARRRGGAETLDHFENVLIIGLHIVRLLAVLSPTEAETGIIQFESGDKTSSDRFSPHDSSEPPQPPIWSSGT